MIKFPELLVFSKITPVSISVSKQFTDSFKLTKSVIDLFDLDTFNNVPLNVLSLIVIHIISLLNCMSIFFAGVSPNKLKKPESISFNFGFVFSVDIFVNWK